jgi:undecaprenyl-diphosphatase
VSSLGHTVLIPQLFGWHNLVRSEDASESFYLAFVVGLHVANALALLVFFWKDWVRIVHAFFRTLHTRRVETSTERLAWLIVVATIPTGLLGLLLEHRVRTLLAKPLSAAIFLMVNGVILLAGERVRRESAVRELAAREGTTPEGSRRLDTLEYREAGIIGVSQTAALIAGISRDGIAMVAGLVRGLDNEDAAKFAFLLATPIILAAGIYKIPDLLGANGNGVRGQVLVGSIVTFFVSLLSVRYLMRYFKTRNLIPFGVYCLAFGAFMTLFIVSGA